MKLILICVLFSVHIISGNSVCNNLTEGDVSIKKSNGCECVVHNCGCCQYLQLTSSLNGTLCANASYLDHDYGISITVTYDDFTLINETVSARNPPPICIGEDIVDMLQAELCLRIYDIDIQTNEFHCCFGLQGRIGKIKIAEIYLGCINNNSVKTSINAIEKETANLLHKMKLKVIEDPPNVIMA